MPRDALLDILAFVPSTDWLCVALTCPTLGMVCDEHAQLHRTTGTPRWVTCITSSLSRMKWAIQMLPVPYFVWHCEDKLPSWLDRDILGWGHKTDLRPNAFLVAARDGHLAVLQWRYPSMSELFQSSRENLMIQAACEAATNAQLSVLEWFHSNKVRMTPKYMWEPAPFHYAIESGDLPTVQFLYTINGYDWGIFTVIDVDDGGVPVPYYLQAKRDGHLHILQWMESKGLPPSFANKKQKLDICLV